MPEENISDETTAAPSTATDASVDSSTQETSATQDANVGKSLLDTVKDALKASTPAEESSTEEDAEEEASRSDSEHDKEKKEEEPKEEESEELEDKTEKEEEKSEDDEPKGPVPLERFQEVNRKYRETEEQLKQVEPLVKSHKAIVDYCAANSITQEQFAQVLEIQALLNTNPQEALKKILPIVEAVQGFTGDKLPADLDAKVKSGALDLSDARELAQLRAQKTYGTQRVEQMQKLQQQKEQAQLQQALTNSVTTWVQGKAKLDPDFKQKAKDDAPDGKFELVYDRFNSLLNKRDVNGNFVNLVKTPADMTALMERAYGEINKTYSSLRVKPATRKSLTHNGSSTRTSSIKSIEEAPSLKDAVQFAMANR